jgi:hypothetical protein
VFVCCAAALTLLAMAIAKRPRLNRFASQPMAVNLALAFVSLLVPLTLLEFTLRPFAELNVKTSIFERDETLAGNCARGRKTTGEESWSE